MQALVKKRELGKQLGIFFSNAYGTKTIRNKIIKTSFEIQSYFKQFFMNKMALKYIFS